MANKKAKKTSSKKTKTVTLPKSVTSDPKIKVKMEVDKTHKTVYVTPYHPFEKKRTFGQKAADWIADFGGSWLFIGLFLFFMTLWVRSNASYHQ